MSPRRIAGEGDGPSHRPSTPPVSAEPDAARFDPAQIERMPPTDEHPFVIEGPLTIWASTAEEAVERMQDLLQKPRPEFRGYRCSLVPRRVRAEPLPAAEPAAHPADLPPRSSRRTGSSRRVRGEGFDEPGAAG